MIRKGLLILCCLPVFSFGQLKEVATDVKKEMLELNVMTKNPLKASLYSAALPGLGQVYNEQYWKVPIVWGLIGTGIGFTAHYNDRYNRLREAFIAELNGQSHEFSGLLNKETLARAQNDEKRNRDYAIVFTVLAYVLNVLDATVDAHLFDIRRDRDLSIDPTAFFDPQTQQSQIGLALKLHF